MPIFMDRHQIEGATRATTAQAHERDLQVSGKYGVTFITYWFDEGRSTTFCLVDARTSDDVKAAHAEAHGSIPNEIIPVDASAVEAFLGRIMDPTAPTQTEAQAAGMTIDSAFRVIMVTDLEGSTAMTQRLGDARAMHFLRIHNALTRTALRDHQGREVKHLGDGVLASFMTADDAADGAIAIQESFRSYSEEHAEQALRVRIGFGAGEPVEEDDDLFGTAVQLASRLCAEAKPGQILMADIVMDLLTSGRYVSSDQGESKLKGFHEPAHIFELHRK